MITVPVDLGDRSYDVLVGAGARHELAVGHARRRPPGRRRDPGRPSASTSTPAASTASFTIGDGERAKSLATVEELCREFARWGLTRADAVVAVGGGLVTDVAGFAAAVYHRGIPVVLRGHDAARPDRRRHRRQDRREPARGQEPGRLVLAAVRRAVRHRGRWPRCRPASCAAGSASWPSTTSSAAGDLDARLLPLDERVAACVRIKADVVAADEREAGRRAILNYGHTLAHALETTGRYDLRHGEAVAVGLVFAAELAHVLGRIDAAPGRRAPAGGRRLRPAVGAAAGQRPGRAGRGSWRRDKKALTGADLRPRRARRRRVGQPASTAPPSTRPLDPASGPT